MREVNKLKGKDLDFLVRIVKNALVMVMISRSWFSIVIGDGSHYRVKFPQLVSPWTRTRKPRWLLSLRLPIDISFRRNARGGIEAQSDGDLTSLMIRPWILSIQFSTKSTAMLEDVLRSLWRLSGT
ncbi:hypothetical protein Tco_0409726 [Tanacetum coccineum]